MPEEPQKISAQDLLKQAKKVSAQDLLKQAKGSGGASTNFTEGSSEPVEQPTTTPSGDSSEQSEKGGETVETPQFDYVWDDGKPKPQVLTEEEYVDSDEPEGLTTLSKLILQEKPDIPAPSKEAVEAGKIALSQPPPQTLPSSPEEIGGEKGEYEQYLDTFIDQNFPALKGDEGFRTQMKLSLLRNPELGNKIESGNLSPQENFEIQRSYLARRIDELAVEAVEAWQQGGDIDNLAERSPSLDNFKHATTAYENLVKDNKGLVDKIKEQREKTKDASDSWIKDFTYRGLNSINNFATDLLMLPATVSSVGEELVGRGQEYTIADKILDWADTTKNPLTTSERQFYKDGEIDWAAAPLGAVDQLGLLLGLAAGNAAAGARAKGIIDKALATTFTKEAFISSQQNLGTIAGGYIASLESNRREAKEMGLSGDDLATYTNFMSSMEGLSELIMPNNRIFSPDLKKRLLSSYLKNLGSGQQARMALQETIRAIKDPALKEPLEELMVMAGKTLQTGLLSLENEDIETYIPKIDEVINTVVTASIAGGIPATTSAINTNKRLKNTALLKAAEDIESTKTLLNTYVDRGMVKPEKANAFINKLGLTEEAIKEIPNEVTTDTKADLLPTAEKLAQKREEAKTKQGVAKKLINEEITILEEKILTTIEDGRETKESEEGTVRDKPKEESKDQAKAESTGSKETSEEKSTVDGVQEEDDLPSEGEIAEIEARIAEEEASSEGYKPISKSAKVISHNGKRYKIISIQRKKDGSHVVKAKEIIKKKDGTTKFGTVKRFVGNEAETIAKDFSLGIKHDKPQRKKRKTKGVPNKQTPEPTHYVQTKIEPEFTEENPPTLEEAEAESKKALDDFENSVMDELVEEEKKSKRGVVEVDDGVFQVIEKEDGEKTVSRMREDGKLIAVRERNLRNKAIKEFVKKRNKELTRKEKEALDLIDEVKKEEQDKLLQLIDKAIEKTDYRLYMFDGSLGLLVSSANITLKILRKAYVATKNLSVALRVAYQYAVSKGYKGSETEFNKWAIQKIKNKRPTTNIIDKDKKEKQEPRKQEAKKENSKPSEEAKNLAKEYGYKSVNHAVSAVNKYTGKKYKTIEEIPANELKKAAEGVAFTAEAKTNLVTRLDEKAEKFKEKIRKERGKIKDLKKRKDYLNRFAKTLLDDMRKAGIKQVPTAKVKSILNQVNKSNTQPALDKAAQKLIDITKATTDSYVNKERKSTINKMKAFAKKAKSVRRASGKARAKSTDPAGQGFFTQVYNVLKAVEDENLSSIENKIEQNKETIEEALLKNDADLTTKERDLLDLVYAYDTFSGVQESTLAELDAMEKGMKDAKRESISRLKGARKKAAARKAEVDAKIDSFIREKYKSLYNEDGTLKTETDKVQQRRMAEKEGTAALIKEWYNAFKERIDVPNLKSILTLDSIATKVDKGTGFIKNNILKPLREARKNSLEGSQRELDKLDNLIKKTFKEFKDANDLIKGLGKEKIEVNLSNGETILMSRLEMMRDYALSKNPTQKEKLEDMGVDEQVLDGMKAEIGEEGVKFVDHLVDYLSNDYYESINKVHEDVNFTRLPKVENYYPTKTERQQGEPLQEDFAAQFNAQWQSALKARVDKNNKIRHTEDGLDFMSELKEYFEEMEHFKAYAQTTKDINNIFRNAGFKQLTKNLLINRLMKAAISFQINEKSAVINTPSLFDKAMSNFTAWTLGFKPIQLVKQGASFINAYEDYSFRKGKPTPALDMIGFAFDVAKMIPRMGKEISEAKKISPLFRDRVENANMYHLYSGSHAKIQKHSENKAQSAGNWFTYMGDILGVMGYKANYNRNIKNGMSPQEAARKFNEYEVTQQSRSAMDMNELQRNRHWAMRAVTAFMSTSFLMYNKAYSSAINFSRAAMRGKYDHKAARGFILSMGMANTLFTMTANIFKLTMGDDDDHDEVYQEMLKAMVGVKMLAAIPLLGSIIEETFDRYALGQKPWKKHGGVNPFDRMLMTYKKALSKDAGWEEYFDAFNITQGMITGINAQWLKGIYKLIAGDEDNMDAVMDMSGVTPSYRPSKEEGGKSGRESSQRSSSERSSRERTSRARSNR